MKIGAVEMVTVPPNRARVSRLPTLASESINSARESWRVASLMLNYGALILPRLSRHSIAELMKDCAAERDLVGPFMKHGYFATQEFFAREVTSPIGKYVNLRCADGACLNAGSYDYLGHGGKCLPEVLQAVDRDGYEQASAGSVRKLEEEIAAFIGKPASVVCATGYSTNANLLPYLEEDDNSLFIADAFIHTSTRIGLRHRYLEFRHNDPNHLEQILLENPGKRIWVFVEGIYSMEGDICPLPELVRLREKHGFRLYVDEAHSIGGLGKTGRGVCEHFAIPTDQVDVLMGTFSKSFASQGGYLASDHALVQRIRAGLAAETDPEKPMTVPCVEQVRAVLKRGMDTTRLRQVTHALRQGLQGAGFEVLGDTDAPVIPVLLSCPTVWARTMHQVTKAGVAVVAVGPPAVPWDSLRLRLCANADYTDSDIKSIIGAFSGAAQPRRALLGGAAHDLVSANPVVGALRRHGVGTCGPFQFYGTNSKHREFERFIASQYGHKHAILYPSAFNMLHSVIGVFGNKNAAILMPREPRPLLLRAARECRGSVYYYDEADLDRMVQQVKGRHEKVYLVVEALKEGRPFERLEEVLKLPVETVLDESLSFGKLGKSGLGLTEHLGIEARRVHHILLSFEDELRLSGGVYLTCTNPRDHKIRSKGYVFSASLPIFCVEAVRDSMHRSAAAQTAH